MKKNRTIKQVLEKLACDSSPHQNFGVLDAHGAIFKLLPNEEEIAILLFNNSIYVEMYGSWQRTPKGYKEMFIKQARPIADRIRRKK